MRYFAYGSNMATQRLRRRVASAKPLGVARLPAYVLRFHKRSQDGSGKCNAFFTGVEADVVLGVLFEIDPAQKQDLDKAEGLGHGYIESHLEVHQPTGAVTAFAYIADPGAIDEMLKPFTWYRDIVIAGAKEHHLPKSYITRLSETPASPDCDIARETRERETLRTRPAA
jgi:hypothetical protein